MQQGLTFSDHQSLSLLRLFESSRKTGGQAMSENWNEDIKVLFELGIGMEETIRYLFYEKPTREEFLRWINSRMTIAPINTDDMGDVLSPDDITFWEENGYIILKGFVSPQECADVRNAIWEFLGASPDDYKTWYKTHPSKSGLMVTFTKHEALERVRRNRKIRKAFEQIYGTTAIYNTVDKVSFNPPENDHYHFAGSKIHWDVSLALPIPFKLQGLLYLNDVQKDGGAFHCVPGFHHHIETWLNALPAGTNPRDHAVASLNPVAVPGMEGDFIIWHQALPHCATPNKSKTPRMVQYLTYLPEKMEDQRAWI